MEKAQEGTRQRRTKKVGAAKKKGINQTVADLELIWRTAIEDNDLYEFRYYIPWTLKEKGMLKHFMGSVPIKSGTIAGF